MTRRRFVQVNGDLVEVTDDCTLSVAPMVQGEIAPYTSMVTGETIESRRQHREHLKRHNLIEYGNETQAMVKRKPFDTAPEKRKELIRVQVDAMRESEFRRALKKDIEHAKWNNRR